MTIVELSPPGTPQLTVTNNRLDADFSIPAADGFPVLPAGQAQDGTLKLSMDCEGLILLKDGTFWISDEYGRTALGLSIPKDSKRIPLCSRRRHHRRNHPTDSIHSNPQRRRILLHG